MRGLFFTGTDTDVGKTVVACGVARLLRRQGVTVRVVKPVATGCPLRDGVRVSDDTLSLAEAAGDGPPEAITPWSLGEPAAPPVAARLEGVRLRLEDLAEAVRRRASPEGLLLVEGVGGLLCPLTEREMVADLAALLGLPLVVVTRRSLGTLNHTLLTVEVARRRGLPLAGVVVSSTRPVEGVAEATCVEELRARLDTPILAVLPYLREKAAEGIQAALAAAPWRELGEGAGS